MRCRSGGLWRGRSWSDWRAAARRIGAWLCSVGVASGDRVAILAPTSARWVEADLGILHAGAVMVPIYPTLLPDSVAEILRDSGAKVVLAQDPVHICKLFCQEAGALLPDLERVVAFEPVTRLQRPDEAGRLDVRLSDVEVTVPACTLEEVLELGEARLREEPTELRARAEALGPESLAAIYYTSGTSGEPKGVMLTHDNFVYETEVLQEHIPVGPSDEQLLFLPLAHIVAKLTVALQLRAGFVTSFAESIEHAGADCAEVRPTFIAGVPRVYEKMQESIESRQRGDARQRVFDWALRVGRRVSALRQDGREPGRLLAVQERSAERLVFSRVKARLGGRLRFMLSGAAPLSKETAELFHALDLLILEGYGLTESTGASTLNRPSAYRFGTVGKPMTGVDVKLDEDGEILLRGRSITPGYWRRGEETRVAFSGGRFHTGDVGVLDADGFLTITDRKKDLIITAGGKNIAPQRVEGRLEQSPYVDRAIAIGDRRKFLVALLVPDAEAMRRWADEQGLPGELTSLLRHPRARALLADEVTRVNRGLASFESIKRFETITDSFSIEEGTLTPTGKVVRRAVAQRFGDVIDSLYEGVATDLTDVP